MTVDWSVELRHPFTGDELVAQTARRLEDLIGWNPGPITATADTTDCFETFEVVPCPPAELHFDPAGVRGSLWLEQAPYASTHVSIYPTACWGPSVHAGAHAHDPRSVLLAIAAAIAAMDLAGGPMESGAGYLTTQESPSADDLVAHLALAEPTHDWLEDAIAVLAKGQRLIGPDPRPRSP